MRSEPREPGAALGSRISQSGECGSAGDCGIIIASPSESEFHREARRKSVV